jgi:sugar phosphate isomerase/epimerase
MTATAELGIFARTFPRPSAAAVADAVAAAGFGLVQLNLSAIGLPTIPRGAELDELDLSAIGRAFSGRGVAVWGVSATFNLIHPDHDRRHRDVAAAADYICRAGELGTRFVTLCTGTRDPDNMWRQHPDNSSAAAWRDLRTGLDHLLAAAAATGIRLGVEPEHGNVVSDADAAARLLAELGDDAALVAVVLDPANLLTTATLPEQDAVLRAAFAALGPSIECVQAKDVTDGDYCAAGVGGLDYDLVFQLWSALPGSVPVVAQDSTELDAPRVHEFLHGLAVRHPHATVGR